MRDAHCALSDERYRIRGVQGKSCGRQPFAGHGVHDAPDPASQIRLDLIENGPKRAPVSVIEVLPWAGEISLIFFYRSFAERITRNADEPLAGKRHAHADHTAEDFGMHPRRAPYHGRAPVMPNQNRVCFAERFDHTHQVADQSIDTVGVGTPEFRRPPIAALLDGDGAVARGGQRRQLMTPRIGKLGKTMNQQDHRPLTLLNGVDPRAIDVEQMLSGL